MYPPAKLPAADKQIFAALIVWVLMLCLFSPLKSQAAGIPVKSLTAETGQQPQIPQGLSPDEVDAYLAGLSDVQARQVLARKLKQEAGAPGPGTKGDPAEGEHAPETLFHELALGVSTVMDQIGSFFSADESSAVKWGVIVDRLSGGKGVGHLMLTVLIGFVLIACGLLVERVFLRLTDGLRQQILNTVALGKLQKLARFISRLLLDALGVGVYILATFIPFVMLFRQEEAGYWIVTGFLIVSYYFWVIRFAAKIVMSPASTPLRLLPLQDRDAKFLYRWIIRISLVAAILITPSLIFRDFGRSQALSDLFFMASGLSVVILMMIMIWQKQTKGSGSHQHRIHRWDNRRLLSESKVCQDLALFRPALCRRNRLILVDQCVSGQQR